MNEKSQDSRGRVCPDCGMGVMPDSGYCIRCGRELPPPPARPELEEREREREKRALAIWFFDIFPGLLSPLVIAVSAACFLASVFSAETAVLMLSRISGWIDLLFFGSGGLAAILAGIALYAAGLLFLFYGAVCNPLEALYNIRGRQWPVFLSLVLAGPALYGLLRG